MKERELLHQIGKLKEVKRAGWIFRGIEHPESVADHSFRCAIIALLCSTSEEVEVDEAKLLKMMLTHDLAESDPSVGDITPLDGIDPKEKHRREREAMTKLCESLPQGDQIFALWLEFEEGITNEAILARQIDVAEMGLQAMEYQKKHAVDLSEFIEFAKAKISNPFLLQLLTK